MKRGYEESEELYEMTAEEMEEEYQKEKLREEMGIPEVEWADDIAKIENPKIRKQEIESAENIQKEEKGLKDKLHSREISKGEYLGRYESGVRSKKRKITTRCGLESVGITYDDFGDLSEAYKSLLSGDIELDEKKQRIRETIDVIGEEAAEGLADKMLEEEKLSERGHESIMRQVRLHRK